MLQDAGKLLLMCIKILWIMLIMWIKCKMMSKHMEYRRVVIKKYPQSIVKNYQQSNCG